VSASAGAVGADPQGADERGQQLVVAHQEHELDRLRVIEVLAQRLPRRVVQILPLVQYVDGSQQRARWSVQPSTSGPCATRAMSAASTPARRPSRRWCSNS
jgi:hypothetical protein